MHQKNGIEQEEVKPEESTKTRLSGQDVGGREWNLGRHIRNCPFCPEVRSRKNAAEARITIA